MENFLITKYFFAPSGSFDACGMFTSQHIIATLICVALIAVCLFIVFKTNRLNICKLLRYSAVILTILELIKISHSFIYKDMHLDAWFPLSYCGLFIFALWMAGFGENHIKRAGEAYITYGCPIAGICFLIFPTTSLMSFPIWHYFSIYSLFFHSLMIFVGIRLLLNEPKLDKATYFFYFAFVLFFALISITMNIIFGCNLMNLREPYNIPIQLLQDIYSAFNPAYTVIGLAFSLISFADHRFFGAAKDVSAPCPAKLKRICPLFNA